ncbi:unnamed protein product, partial [Closterium sp. NIES-53]
PHAALCNPRATLLLPTRAPAVLLVAAPPFCSPPHRPSQPVRRPWQPARRPCTRAPPCYCPPCCAQPCWPALYCPPSPNARSPAGRRPPASAALQLPAVLSAALLADALLLRAALLLAARAPPFLRAALLVAHHPALPAMASLNVLTFDHEGLPIQFDTWLDDLQLYVLSDSRDRFLLFDHTSGTSLAPPATGDSATRSQWLTRDAAARLAIRKHLPLAESAHFEFGDEVERPCWLELLRHGVDIFALDYDVILAAMYALSVSAEVDCYLCVPPDPSIEAAALGASESALPSTAPAEALHTFTLDSGASRYFFRDSTNLTPLSALVLVRLADPSGGPVLACSSTVLPCPAVLFDSLSGLHLPPFATNLVSALGLVTAPSSCRLLSHQTLLWHHRLGQPSLPCLRGMHSHLLVSDLPRSMPPLLPSLAPPCLPFFEGRKRAAPYSSFPLTTATLQTLHMDVWGPARVSGQGRERYFLLVIDDYTRYTAVRLQLRERFREDLPVLCLHSDIGGEFSSDLLREFCRVQGVLQSFTLLASLQQSGVAERRIGLVMEVWGSRAFVCDTSVDKLSSRAISCIFLVFPTNAPGWQYYHPTSRRVLSSQDVTFNKSVPFYHFFPYRTAPLPPPLLFLALGPPPVDPLPPQGPAPSGLSQVDPLPLAVTVEVAEDSGAGRVAASGGAASGGAAFGDAAPVSAELGGAEPEGAELGDAEPKGAESEVLSVRVRSPGVIRHDCLTGGSLSHRREPLSPQQLREWFAQWTRIRSGATGAEGPAAGGIGAGGAGAASPGGARTSAGGTGAGGAGASSPGGAGVIAGAGGTGGAGAARAGGVGGAGAGGPGAGVGSTSAGGAGAGGASAGGAGAGGAGAGDPGAGGAGATGDGVGNPGGGGTVQWCPFFVPPSPSALPPPDSVLRQVLNSPLPAHSPYAEKVDSFTERRDPRSRPALPVCASYRVPCPRPPPFPGTHVMALRPSSVPLRVPLPPPPASSHPHVLDLESDLPRAGSPTIPLLLATIVTDPSFESTAASAQVAELVEFVAASRIVYTASLVAESESECPPSIWGECALGTDVLEDRQDDFEFLAAAVPHLVAMLLAYEGDPDAPDIPTPRSYAEAITATGFDFFHTFSPTQKMTTLRVLLHVASQRDYELPSLDFSTTFLQGSLHEEIWLRRPPSFIGLFPAGTQWSLRWLFYNLYHAPHEWHDTLRMALGFAPSTADQSLFLCTDTLLRPFYVLVYVDDLVFATADTKALALVKSELQKRHTCTDLGELRSYLGLQITRDRARRTITLTQSHMVHQVLQRFGFGNPRHSPLLCLLVTRSQLHLRTSPTSGMGLMLGGWGPVVLAGHKDASCVDDLATQQSSNCEAEIYEGAMAAQELRWLTYLLTDLGERPRSSPVLYVDNKAIIALCQEHRLEHRTKHIAL